MTNYKDSYGRFHHKPVTSENPIPSNNGWIYTAYAEKVGVPVDKQALQNCADECRVWKNGFMAFYRSPGKEFPPQSRDEILGLASLGLLHPNLSEHKNWNFSPTPLPKFSLGKFLKQLWQLRPSIETQYTFEDGVDVPVCSKLVWKHRNYFWQNNLDQLYRFAFSVPVVDRHFILQKWGKKNYFYAAIAYIDSKLGKHSGIRFLKYGKSKEAMAKEFPADHPITLAVK
jgi:hypothetical protein